MLRNILTIALSLTTLSSVCWAKSQKTNLTPELQTVYKLAGLKVKNNKIYDECEEITTPEIREVDLNHDRQKELIVIAGGSGCYGTTGAKLTLLIKNNQNKWIVHIDHPAIDARILTTKHHGFDDIELGMPGRCMPVWAYNGQRYKYLKEKCE